MVIPAVILAAGKSSRMGRPKALLPVDASQPHGDTFVTRIVRTMREAGVTDVTVVLGHEATAIQACLAASGLPARIVVNPDYETGQLSSFLSGLRAADRPDTEALLVTLVDVPLVSAATVRAVIARYRERRPPIVRPVRGDAHGHPVLIDRSLFPLLERADPDTGIKPIVRAHVSQAGDVEVGDADAFLDVDTPSEYTALLTRRPPGAREGAPS